ncbi:hypothetical protein EDD68_102175 [Melghiribacillus thermohalophilus]|uniref:Sulfotransferase family protein n=2 Tax=Melghiribacillus thermohalophilus TaxID=1324956 RepID=A0A4R3NGP3_9BACI|nr:hypothetical protein EDD68_102175 [Melghiribacillus thermohalophilus]
MNVIIYLLSEKTYIEGKGNYLMNTGFIHIGMMKTASTYMQNVWLRDKSYSLSWRGTMSFLEKLRETAKKDDAFHDLSLDIHVDRNLNKGETLVISNEGFSTAYLNQLEFQAKIPHFIDLTSRNLGKLAKETPNLLMVIREPLSWIRSIYIQSIKEGWSGSAQEFVDRQFTFLKHSLDLEHILGCYQRYFGNILILPYEILKQDEQAFWEIISYSFNTPVAETRISEKLNPSLDVERVYLLSKLNGMNRMILNNLAQSDNYRDAQEKTYLVKNHAHTGKWVHRRFVEFANDEKIKHLYSMFNITEPEEDFLHFHLPAELSEVIRSKFINFLKAHILPDYPEFYEQELENHLQNKHMA